MERKTLKVEREQGDPCQRGEEGALGGGRCVRGGTSDWPLMSEKQEVEWSVGKVSPLSE